MHKLAFRIANAPTCGKNLLAGVLPPKDREILGAAIVAWSRLGLFYYLPANWTKTVYANGKTTWVANTVPPAPFVHKSGGWTLMLAVPEEFVGLNPWRLSEGIRNVLRNIGCPQAAKAWEKAVKEAPILDAMLL